MALKVDSKKGLSAVINKVGTKSRKKAAVLLRAVGPKEINTAHYMKVDIADSIIAIHSYTDLRLI